MYSGHNRVWWRREILHWHATARVTAGNLDNFRYFGIIVGIVTIAIAIAARLVYLLRCFVCSTVADVYYRSIWRRTVCCFLQSRKFYILQLISKCLQS